LGEHSLFPCNIDNFVGSFSFGECLNDIVTSLKHRFTQVEDDRTVVYIICFLGDGDKLIETHINESDQVFDLLIFDALAEEFLGLLEICQTLFELSESVASVDLLSCIKVVFCHSLRKHSLSSCKVDQLSFGDTGSGRLDFCRCGRGCIGIGLLGEGDTAKKQCSYCYAFYYFLDHRFAPYFSSS